MVTLFTSQISNAVITMIIMTTSISLIIMIIGDTMIMKVDHQYDDDMVTS